jgi:hypothetical protein
VDEPSEPRWSDAVNQAAWINGRLLDFATCRTITGVVPSGFEAYARVLHPVETRGHGDRLVRWHEVAGWSGRTLHRDSQFHSIAFPAGTPETAAPWEGQGPEQGVLYPDDAMAIAETLRQWTATPEQCWFCIWDGYGWSNVHQMTSDGTSSVLPDPVPESVRNGPRVHLPHRDYLLYSGPVEAALATLQITEFGETPNLWWPEDRSWLVATEIDLAWTYVGGPRGMIEALLADRRIEALPADPADSPWHVAPWLKEVVDTAIDELLGTGQASIDTTQGSVTASFVAPRTLRPGQLRTRTVRSDGGGSGVTPIRTTDPEEIRGSVELRLTMSVIALVGG